MFRKTTFLLVLGMFLIPNQGFAQQQWSQGYWTPWGNPGIPPTAIEWGGLTHVVHAWALVRADGSLDLDTERISADGPTLVSNAHAHGVKALLGVGQPYWLGQTTNFQSAINGNRTGLVNNIINTMNAYGFDGVDLDWEPFNGSTNGSAMQAFAADLRNRLGTTKTLSAAAIVTDYAFWGSVQSYFDRISAMTYDLTGTWNPYSWHNAALYDTDGMVWSVDLTVRRFTAAGVPASKLSIGIPFFGYRWQGGGVNGPRQTWYATPSTQQIYYQGIAGSINGGNYRWDSSAAVPYLSMSDQFWTYDNEQSVAEKVRYAQNRGLGGWIIWELFGDYFPGQNPNQPLLVAIKNARTGSTPPPSPPPPSPPPPSPPASPPPSPSSTLKATYVGATGQDLVGTEGSGANGNADWHIQLQGLRGTPTRVRVTSSSGGIWDVPFNGTNWVIATQYAGNGTGDLWFEPWLAPNGFHVKVWYPDSTTDEVDTTSSSGGSGPALLKATYVGATGQDVVGPSWSPNGTADWHIQLQGLRGTPARVQITGFPSGVWEAPFNGSNWVVAGQYGANGTGDLWFEPWSSTGFHVKVWYADSSTDEVDATSGVGSTTTLRGTFLGAAGDVVGTHSWSPNGSADWHIQLQGVRASIIKVRITSGAGGIWENPFNGSNWVIGGDGYPDGTQDLWFEPWFNPGGFRVNVWYSDGSVDQTDAF